MPVGNVCFEPYPQGPVELSLMEPYHAYIFSFLFSQNYICQHFDHMLIIIIMVLLHYFHAASLPTSIIQLQFLIRSFSLNMYIYKQTYEYICLFWVCMSPSRHFLAKLGDTYPIENRMRATIKRENPESIIRDRDFIVARL